MSKNKKMRNRSRRCLSHQRWLDHTGSGLNTNAAWRSHETPSTSASVHVMGSDCAGDASLAGLWTPDAWQRVLLACNAIADGEGWDSPHRLVEVFAKSVTRDKLNETLARNGQIPQETPSVAAELVPCLETYGDPRVEMLEATVSENAVAAIMQCEMIMRLLPPNWRPEDALPPKAQMESHDVRLIIAVTRWGDSHALMARRTGDHSSEMLGDVAIDTLKSPRLGFEGVLRKLLNTVA